MQMKEEKLSPPLAPPPPPLYSVMLLCSYLFMKHVVTFFVCLLSV